MAERNSLGALCGLVRLAPGLSGLASSRQFTGNAASDSPSCTQGAPPVYSTHLSHGGGRLPAITCHHHRAAQMTRNPRPTGPGISAESLGAKQHHHSRQCPQSKPAVSHPALHLLFGQGCSRAGMQRRAGPGKFPGPTTGRPRSNACHRLSRPLAACKERREMFPALCRAMFLSWAPSLFAPKEQLQSLMAQVSLALLDMLSVPVMQARATCCTSEESEASSGPSELLLSQFS